ncbi:LysR family transcriptional regulator [Mycolicibacterium neworleansense]|uniref:LysR family transcriptional regulator n=2 Tax=Mycolicibacterium neworleansense TaxID=146018 RepID=A0A0H5RTY5_9MYCO|nr:LysR family transcriptional regulator [Mycolicibacterium neworleansense]CRZ17383.1 LysR family transcriptional regulator [Mycolicibacterium neworleansense]
MHIGGVDLNLIPPLLALLEERQVSRAAERVGLSQPAMSRALQRLRRLLGDPLLVRDSAGYRLTARAESIRTQLVAVLPQLETLFAPDHFDPKSATAPVRLAATDYAVQAFGPAICQAVLRQSTAPVRFRSWSHESVAEQIRDSGVDLGLFGGYTTADLHSEELLVERFVCLLASDHPLAGHDSIALADYVRARHVIVDVHNGVQPDIDHPLQKLGYPRQAAVIVPYHSVAAQLLPGTDLIATLPSQCVSTLISASEFQVLNAPEEIATMAYRMVWHPGLDNDARHQWLRGVVRTAVRRTVG